MADKILEVTAARINAAVKKVEKLPEQGVAGADGKSAYQIWLEQGNRGTEQDFLNSLKGQSEEIVLRKNETHIQWCYKSELSMKNIQTTFKSESVTKEVNNSDIINEIIINGVTGNANKFKVKVVSILAKNELDKPSGSVNPSSVVDYKNVYDMFGGFDPTADAIDIVDDKVTVLASIHEISRYGLKEIQKHIPEANYISNIIVSVELLNGEEFVKNIDIKLNVSKQPLNIANDGMWRNLVSLEEIKGRNGNDGVQGEQGFGWLFGQNEPSNEGRNGDLYLRYTTFDVYKKTGGSWQKINNIKGSTPSITVGTVSTLEPGQQATVTKRGTDEAPIFDFGIPKGQKGADGVGGNIEGHTHSNKTELDKIVEGDKAKWDAKSNFSGSYNDLTEKPTKLSQFQNDIGLSGGNTDLSGYQTKTDETLSTTDKTIVGAINENKSSLDDIKTNTYNKLEVDKKISDIVLESGNIVFRDVLEGEIFTLDTGSTPTITYGQIVLSTTTLTLNENASTTFTVKLDKAPTNNQVVNIGVNNGYCTINPTTLTFTPSNYNQPQTVTVTGVHDSSHYSAKNSTITISSANVTSKNITVTINNIDSQPSEVVNVQSVTLNKPTHTMKINETLQLTPVITPPNATNQEVTWETNNSNCTVVGGLVTAKAEGECVITCKTVDGNKTDTCTFTIQAKENGDINDMLLNYDFRTLSNGAIINSTIADLSGNGNDGTLTNYLESYNPQYFGIYEGSLVYNFLGKMDGSSNLNVNSLIINKYPCTFEFYVKQHKPVDPVIGTEKNFTNDSGTLFTNSSGTGSGMNINCSIYYDNHSTTPNALGIVGQFSQPNILTDNNSVFAFDNTWKHIVMVLGSDYQKIYVNGILVKSGNATSTNISSNTKTTTLLQACPGSYKVIRIYNKELTQSEVELKYRELRGDLI